jgi:hypothetical protein
MPQMGLARTCRFATALIQKLNAESLRAAHCITILDILCTPRRFHAADGFGADMPICDSTDSKAER